MSHSIGWGRTGVRGFALAFVVLFAVVPTPVAASDPGFAPPEADSSPSVAANDVTYTVPPNYDTFVQWWRDLETAYPGYLHIWSPNQQYGLGQIPSSSSHLPYDLYYVRLTNEALGFSKPEVFFMGNPHGDERAGVIGTYWFVNWTLRHALAPDWNTPYDDWLNWLLDNREVYFGISHNPDGFDQIRRCDALNRDLNREADHDGPGTTCTPQDWTDVFQSVQGRTVARFMEEHQIRVGSDFHGGIRAMLYPWGSSRSSVQAASPVTGRVWSYAPPDFYYYDVFGHRMGDFIGDYGGNYGATNVGTPPAIVMYEAQGTYLNWAYGSNWVDNPREDPYVRYGPYRGGAFWYTPEISVAKNPLASRYGSDTILGWGIDVRRTILPMIDIAQPYVRWHPSGVADGGSVEVGASIDLTWQVNGSLVVDATEVLWGADPDPVNNPSFITSTRTDFAGQWTGGTGWDGALDGDTSGWVWQESIPASMPVGTYYFVARAKVDQRYKDVLSPVDYGTNSYLRIIKERTWTGWSEDLVGADGLEHMESHEWWYSPVLRVDIVPDMTPPVITLVAPPNGAVIRPGTILDFEVYDANLASVTVSVDGGMWTPITPPFDIDTSSWNDGPHSVRIEAWDSTGLSSPAQTYSFVVDGMPPAIALVMPAEGSVVAAGSIVDFDVTDPHFASAAWTIGGPTSPLIAPFDVDTAGWPEGPVTVQVTAVDIAGNVASEAFDFVIDVGPPTVALLSPPPNSVIRAGTILDFEILDMSAIAATWESGGGPQSLPAPYDVDTAGWPDGAVSVGITATDAFGRTTTTAFGFEIDSTPPEITLVSPNPFDVVQPGTTIDLAITDLNLDTVTWDAGPGPALLAAPFDIPTTGWTDGPRAFTITATDTAGNTALLGFTIEIDGSPPTILRADTGSILPPGHAVMFQIQDANLDAAFWATGGPESPLLPPFGVSTTGWTDGDYTIGVRAVDAAGNEATFSVMVTIDGTPPAVALTSPVGVTLAKPGVALQYAISDAHLDRAVLRVDGIDTPLGAPYLVDTAGWSDGTYAILVLGYDLAGNSASVPLDLDLDGTPPVLGTPTAEGPRVGSPVIVRITATDAHGPASVILHWRIGGGAFAAIAMDPEAAGSSTFVAQLPAPNALGTIEFYVAADDELGNAAESEVQVFAIGPALAEGLPAYLLAIPVIALGILLIVLVRRRRRRDDSSGAERTRDLGEQGEQEQDEEEPGRNPQG